MSLRDLFARGIERQDPVLWIDTHIKVSEIGEPFHLADYQREVLRTALRFDRHGYLPYRTILLSMPKKSGKSTLNALLVLWWGMMIEPPNELYVLANDEEQARGRVYRAVVQLLQRNAIDPTAQVLSDNITLSNGTTIQVLSSDYTSSAGANMGLSSWDELWGYTSERSQRLYEEMVPVLTRKNSIRLITSYAGIEGESKKLHSLYLLGVDTEEHPAGQGTRIHPTLPIYENAAAELFCYWDHASRAAWQQGPKAAQYLATQKQDLRLSTFLRYYFNRWSSSESAFLSAMQYDACVDHTLRRHSLPKNRLFLGVDAATKRDCASVVGVTWAGEDLVLQCHQIWTPTKDTPINLEETIETYVLELCAQCPVSQVYADPYQMARSIQTLQAKGISIVEYAQVLGNLTQMGTTLSEFITGRKLHLYPAPDLREHALNAVAIESIRGWKIAKEKASGKVDGLVALAMACRAAVEAGHVEAVSIPPDEMEHIWREADAEHHREALQTPAVPEPDRDDENPELERRARPRFWQDRPPRWGRRPPLAR